LREHQQSTTIVVACVALESVIGFRMRACTHVRRVQGNAMEIGVRDEWIECVTAACDAVSSEAIPRRARSVRRVFRDFLAQLPDPASSAERAVLRAMLVEVSLRWGDADHCAYHADFPDAECTDDPATLALSVWRSPPADARAGMQKWTATYVDTMERVHPRYRAVELRRDLDADFAQPLSIGRLARDRGVTARCLQRDFEELTGQCIQDYVRERRVEAAVGMLKTTSDKVEWIANVVGWSSRKNLNRALARSAGTSPSTLRSRR
jgi:AraC-like DNA-binding protein